MHNRCVYYRGQIVMEQGASATSAFYIESGSVEICVEDGPHMLTIATLGPGEIVGEMALIQHGERSATVRALEDTVVTEISHEWLESKIHASDDKMVQALLKLFVRRLRDANRSQINLYRSLAEFQDRVSGLGHRAMDAHLDQTKRAQFRREAAPLIDALNMVLQKYMQ
jgi:CRP-like cAMP-binding protein